MPYRDPCHDEPPVLFVQSSPETADDRRSVENFLADFCNPPPAAERQRRTAARIRSMRRGNGWWLYVENLKENECPAS